MCLCIYEVQCIIRASQEALCLRTHRRRRRVPSLGWETPWRRAWQPTPLLLPGEPQGQRSLAGCSPQGRREQDTTKAPEHTHTHTHRNVSQQTSTAAHICLGKMTRWLAICYTDKTNLQHMHFKIIPSELYIDTYLQHDLTARHTNKCIF